MLKCYLGELRLQKVNLSLSNNYLPINFEDDN